MECLDRGECPAAFLGVREGFGFFERLVAGADRPGEPVLIEFGRLRFPPACLRNYVRPIARRISAAVARARPFTEGKVRGDDAKMTTALLDRLTHHCDYPRSGDYLSAHFVALEYDA
jgi:hypothetical protein